MRTTLHCAWNAGLSGGQRLPRSLRHLYHHLGSLGSSYMGCLSIAWKHKHFLLVSGSFLWWNLSLPLVSPESANDGQALLQAANYSSNASSQSPSPSLCVPPHLCSYSMMTSRSVSHSFTHFLSASSRRMFNWDVTLTLGSLCLSSERAQGRRSLSEQMLLLPNNFTFLLGVLKSFLEAITYMQMQQITRAK